MNQPIRQRLFSGAAGTLALTVRRVTTLTVTRVAMTLILAVLTTVTAWADDVNITADGSTISTETTWTDCTVNITGSGTVYFSKRINISGAVTLNLGEGATLTDYYGIHVSEGNSLTIAGTGTLITGGKYQNGAGDAAGIGGNSNETCGTINITGGNITATGCSAAGIGGGGCGGGGGFINISGGNVTATGDGWSAGIGGGKGSNGVTGAAGTINISGGVVNANGSAGGAGIGGGGYSNGTGGAGGTITISGGQVTARGGNSGGSGIGTGYGTSNGGSEGTITLSWTDDTDWIDASSYVGNIGFVEGKRFYYYDTADYVDANGLYKQSKKIVPAIANNSSLAFAVIQMPRSYVTTNGTAVTVSYEVYDYNSNKLTLGTDYNAIIKNSSNEEVTTFDQLGDYTLTVTGTGTYTGSKTYTFSLVEWDLELTQDDSGYYVNLPENGTKTVSLNVNQSIKVYDSGGKDGALVASDGRLLLQVPDGYALEVTGKTDAMRYNTANSLWVNSLSAYEGDSFSNEIFLLQTNSDNIIFASGGNVMLMRLNVPELYTFESQYGLDLTVRVIPQQSYTITKGTVSNGSIDIADNKTTANTNEMITLTVNPAEGYLLKRIAITDTDGGSTIQTIGEDQWYSGVNTVSFKMPSRNVTITPEFTNSLTAAGGLSMNIDLSGTKECVIPEIVQSFNIRASAVDNPTGWGYATIILRAHNGYCLQATGQMDFVNTQNDDGVFSLYDGSGTSSPSALLINVEGKNKEKVSIGTQTSSSNYMTISLSEDGPYNSVFTGTIETQIKNYSITYDLAGGSVATENPTTYNYKTDAFTLTNPTREGYTFVGWTGTDLGAATTTVTIAAGSYGNRSYTATWTPIAYTITYNGVEGATFANANPATYTVESAAITLNNPTREGYDFGGWYNNSGLTGDAVTTIAAGSTGDVVLWAKWTAIEYNITYNGVEGATFATANPTTYTIESDAITLTNPTKDGYSFAGWTGTGLTEATTTVTIAHGSTGDKSYTATWTASTYAVTVTPGDNMTKTSGEASQTVNAGDAMTDVVYTANEGYYFPTDYSVDAVNGVSVTRNSYTQITVSGSPTAAAEITLTAPTAKTKPVAPTTPAASDCTTAENNDGKLTGVTTDMEYKKSDAESWMDGTGSDITGLTPGTYYVRIKATDTTLASDNQELTIAAYVVPTYTVTVNNGTGSNDYEAGASVTITANDPGSGWQFKEWTGTDGLTFTNGNATTATATFTMPARNVTVTATWKKLLTITAASDSKEYDETALTKNNYTAEGLLAGDVIESVTITGSQTDVGSSDNVPSAAVIKNGDTDVTANYSITYVNGTLTVTAKQIESESGTIVTQDENGYSVTVDERNGSGAVINGTVLDANGEVSVASLDYDRPLSVPTETDKDVTIGGEPAKLYTTCLPTIPTANANVKYYTLASVSGTTLHFTEVTSPAADTPYLMAVTGSSSVNEDVTASNVTLKKTVTGSTANGYTMMGTQTGLTNSDAKSAASIADNATYILQAGSKWGKVTDKAGVYIPPFRAYITGPKVKASSARQMNSSFGDDDATGIDSIRTTDADGTERWYDLNGRRIAKPNRKGLYIRNGKVTTTTNLTD